MKALSFLILSFFLLAFCRSVGSNEIGSSVLLKLKEIEVTLNQLLIYYELHNISNQNIHLCKRNLPLEDMVNNQWELKINNLNIPYIGPNVKRGSPKKSEFIILRPKSHMEGDLDIKPFYDYDIKSGKSISIRYRGRFPQEDKINILPSNTIKIRIPKR